MASNRHVDRLGFWGAVLSLLFGVSYIVAQIADTLVLVGPRGGPLSLTALMLPSFFLAFTFVILLVSVHYAVPQERRIFSHIALAFGIMYAVMITIVYYMQLTLVVPNVIKGTTGHLSVWLFKPFDSFLFALDLLGYGVMNLSTLLLAFAFPREGPTRRIRLFLFLNGIFFPTNWLGMLYPPILALDIPWAITFPVSMVLLALWFRGRLLEHEQLRDARLV